MDIEEFNESQKTVYLLKKRPHKRQKLNKIVVSNEGLTLNDPQVPFLRLLQGQEPLENVKLRYKLFSDSINSQDTISKKIIDETSNQTLSTLSDVISRRVIPRQTDTALLLSSASSTTSSGFVSQLLDHLEKNNNNKVIRLSAKECHTIKISLKKIVGSVLNDNFAGTDDQLDNDSDDEEGYDDDDDDEGLSNLQQRRLPFDLDAVEQWCEKSFNRKGETLSNSQTRIILVFEDTDSFNLGLLNDLMRLINLYTDRIPFKLVLNIGTSAENFSKKVDNDLSHLLRFHYFNIEQTDSILNRIVSEILIKDDYLLGNESVYALLKRFENSIRDINEFLKSLKFLKMIFFFNQPLCVLKSLNQSGEKRAKLNDAYFEALRMLPSFERYINDLASNDEVDATEILKYLDNNQSLLQLILQSTNEYLKNLNNFRSIFSLITRVLAKFIKINGNYLEFYARLTNKDELVRNQFIKEILSSLKSLEKNDMYDLLEEVDLLAKEDDIIQSLNSKVKASIDFKELDTKLFDPEYSRIQYKIEYRKTAEHLIILFENLIKNSLKTPFDMNFNECFQYNDYEVLKSNLTPQTRTIIEDSLTNPELYINTRPLSHSPVDRLNSKINPIIAELFQIYRETNLSLNIFDFYEVFKNSLKKDEIMKDLNEVLDSKDNILEKYLNDELRFKFIYQFFNDVGITDEAKWDKLTLVLFLQKCGELIDCGFCKQIKRKGDSIEKCIWRGL